MRHRKSGRRLGRNTAHRKALLKNLASDLFRHERITTTLPKAKELRPFAEKLITLGKKGDPASRRNFFSRVRNKEITKKMFEDIAPRFADRAGGYTRIFKLGKRDGDAADYAIIELVKEE